MKKVFIISSVICLAVSYVAAEGAKEMGRENMRPSMPVMQSAPPVTLMTGDATVDAQIKALQKEMEMKIQALRNEYQAKIKVIIGDKKLVPAFGSTTSQINRRGDQDDEGREGGRGMVNGSSTRPPFFNERMNGSTTPGNRGEHSPENFEARKEGDMQKTNQGKPGLVRDFFSKLFGR